MLAHVILLDLTSKNALTESMLLTAVWPLEINQTNLQNTFIITTSCFIPVLPPFQLSGGCELTVVIHDFVASNGSSGELTVRRGQTVEVLERLHDKPDWCLVRTTDRSPAQEGIVPCSMLCIAHSRSSMEMEGLFNHKGRRWARPGICIHPLAGGLEVVFSLRSTAAHLRASGKDNWMHFMYRNCESGLATLILSPNNCLTHPCTYAHLNISDNS